MELEHATIGVAFNPNLTGLEKAEAAMKQLQTKAEGLGSVFDRQFSGTAGEKRLASLMTKMDELKKNASINMELKTGQTSADITKVNNQVGQLQKQVTKVMDHMNFKPTIDTHEAVGQVNVLAAKTESTGKAAEKSGNKYTRFGQQATNFGVAAKVAMVGLGAGFAYAAKDAMSLQHTYTVIRNLAVTGGEKQAEAQRNVNAMTKQGKQYSMEYGVEQGKLATGYEELVRRGYSTNQALSAQKTFLQGALASGDDYTDVVHNATAALESFGMRSNSTAQMTQNTKAAMNQMAYAADLTATDFKSLGYAMTYVGATAHSAHQSLGETSSAIGILSNNGQEASVAGTGLRKVLDSLLSPGPKSGEPVLESMGLTAKSFRDAHGNLKSLSDDFALLNQHTKGMTDTERVTLFHKLFGATGQESAAILSKNASALKDLDKQVEGAQKQSGGGYIAKLSKKNLNTWQGQLALFKSTAQATGQDLAKSVLPTFTKILTGFNKMLKSFDELPDAAKSFISFGAVGVAALIPLITAIGAVATGIGAIQTLSGKIKDKRNGSIDPGATGTSTKKRGPVNRVAANIGSSPTRKRPFFSHLGNNVTTGIGNYFTPSRGTHSKLNRVQSFGLNLRGSIGNGARRVTSMPKRTVAKSAGLVRQAAGGVSQYFNPSLARSTRSQRPSMGIRTRSRIGRISSGTSTIAKNLGRGLIGKTRLGSSSRLVRGISSTGRGLIKAAPMVGIASIGAAALDAKKGHRSTAAGSAGGAAFGGILGDMTPLGPLGGMLGTAAGSYLGGKAGSLLDSKKGTGKAMSKLKADGKKLAGGVKAAWTLITKSPTSKKAGKAQDFIENNFGKMAPKINTIVFGIKGSMSKLGKAFNVVIKPLKSFGKWLNKSFGSTFKQLGKTVSPVVKDIGNAMSTMGKAVSSAIHKYFGGKGGGLAKSVASTLTAMLSAAKPIIKLLSGALVGGFKLISGGIRVVLDLLKNIFSSSIGSWVHIFKGALDVIKGVFRTFKDVFTGDWKSLGKDIGTVIKGFVSILGGAIGAVINTGIGVLNTALDGIQSLINKLPKAVRPKWKLHVDPVHFATGTKGRYPQGLPKDTLARVNDGGARELILLPNGRGVIPKRMNTDLFLPAGSHVLNGRDTKRVMGSAQHFASGTVQLGMGGNSAKADLKLPSKKLDAWDKHNQRTWKDTTKTTAKSVKQISTNTTANYGSMTKKLGKTNDNWNAANTKDWKDIASVTDKQSNQAYKDATKNYDKLANNLSSTSNGILKDWKKTWTEVTDFFNTQFGRLGKYAHNGMSDAVTSLNGGIKAIDTTLSQFGGNKAVLSPIHYATGTKGPIANDQMAVLNDAGTGPRQELVVRDGSLLKPHGNDTLTHLRKGDEVLNGTQSQRMMSMMPHYAKGTGVSEERLISLAKKNSGSPKAAWKSEFTDNLGKVNSSVLAKGLQKTAAGAASSVGPAWSGAMWSLINNTISGGTSNGSLSPHFSGPFKESSGYGPRSGDVTDNHKGIDFSAPMGTPIPAQYAGTVVTAGSAQGFGNWVVIRPNGANINTIYGHMRRYRVHAGEHVRAGQIIANVGAEGEATGPHVHYELRKGLGSGDFRPNPDTYKAKIKKPKMSGDKGLAALVKKQLGSTAIKWIEKHLSSSFGSMANPSGAGATRWAAAVKKALSARGISPTGHRVSSMLKLIQRESGGNPKIVQPGSDPDGDGSGPAMGLGQTKRGTFEANKAKGHNNIFNGYDNLLAAVNYIKHRYGTSNAAFTRVATLGYANGGWSSKPAIFGEVPGQPEIAINPARGTADKHIMEAIMARSRKAPNSPIAKLFKGAQGLIDKGFDTGTDVKPASSKKAKATNTRPVIKVDYHPQITIKVDGNGDVKSQAKAIARELVQQMFKELKQDYDPA